MLKTIYCLQQGFQSSSGVTDEFLRFMKAFRAEFKKELLTIGATDIKIEKGHFYVSGFFTVNQQPYYFSISDVRGMDHGLRTNPLSCMSQMLYRTARNYKDYTGGHNQYVPIKPGMARKMELHKFKEFTHG